MGKSILRRKQMHPLKEPAARVDPYRSRCKVIGTPSCPECGSVSFRGRWVEAKQFKLTKPLVPVAGELKCPACRQRGDHFALGVVEIRGDRWKAKSDLVNQTIQNTEKIARVRNDQERILWTKDLGE